MNRRGVVIGAAGAVAAIAGAGVAWKWPRGESGQSVDGAASVDVWSQRFDRPGGGELVFAEQKGRPLLLNFWATWCAPCIREMPMLDRFHRSAPAGGLQVIGLAVDSPTPVRDYLAKTPMTFPIGLAGFGGVDLSKGLGNAQGSLPFSVLFARDGQVVDRKLGALTDDELERWARRVKA